MLAQAPISPQDALAWQASRRKSEARCDCPVSGFGPAGAYTLWLPTPAAIRRAVFRAGKPIMETAGPCFDDPAIAEARDAVLASLESIGGGILQVDIAFLAYAAAVIGVNYTMSDDDLTMLLTGTAWHQGVMRHLIGGDDYVETLLESAPDLVERLRERPMFAVPLHQEPDPPARRRARWWRPWRS